jgi:hypothetical protein
MEPSHGWIAAPEVTEDLDQHVEPLPWIRLGHPVVEPDELSSSCDVVENGFQQSAPRSELIIDRKSRNFSCR